MKPNDKPRLVFWELTKRCNLKCRHCRAEAEDHNYSDELSDNDRIYLSDISNINISTAYPNAWYNFINTSFKKDAKNNMTFYKGAEYVKIEKIGPIVRLCRLKWSY